jgi:hypothetical protein
MTKLSTDIQATSVVDVLLGQRCTHGAARPPRRPCHRRERGNDPLVHCRAVTKRAWASLLCGSALFPVLLATIIPLRTKSAPKLVAIGSACAGGWLRRLPSLFRLLLGVDAVRRDRAAHQPGPSGPRPRLGKPPDATATLAALQACRECVVAVDILVLDETERWVQEFKPPADDRLWP